MLTAMLLTPSVMTVNRGTGAGVFALMLLSPFTLSPSSASLEQAKLFSAALRPGKMIRGQFRTPLVEPELLAGDLESAADHPGHWTRALHPRPPLRVVIAPAAHIADQGEDVAIAVGVIRHQPFAKEIAYLERQPQQYITGFLDARMHSRIEDALDLGIVQRREQGGDQHRGRHSGRWHLPSGLE